MESWYTQPQRQIFNHSCGECGFMLLRCVTNFHERESYLLITFFSQGCQSECLCLEGLLWKFLFSTLHRVGYSWL